MKKIIQNVKKNKLIYILIIISIIKILIVQVQPLNAKYAMKYDDQLMVNLANNIIEGKWLGEYSKNTLIKGVFTPLFMVFINILHIPFLLGKEIFYSISCILFINVLKKKIKNTKILIIMFIALLFNPVEYSSELCRVYRDGIYTALIMYLITAVLGIYLSRNEETKKQIKYYIGLGLSFSAIYLCREENIWLAPFLIGSTIIILINIFTNRELKNKIQRICLYLIPIFITLISINTICFINYKYYGVYTLNQYWGKEFKEAYGALTRVIPEEQKIRVPVTNETMDKIYEVSPKFAELREFFEGEKGKSWSNCGEKNENEINGGYFHWALMEAVESKGYYKDAKTANNYYKQLAEEINKACDEGHLNGRDKKRVSNTCYFTLHDIISVIKEIPHTIKYQYRYEEVSIEMKQSAILLKNHEEIKKRFENITLQGETNVIKYEKKINNIRINILLLIKKIYEFLNPYLFYISIAFFIIFIIYNIKNIIEVKEEVLILLGLLTIYVSRIFIITFTKTLMYEEALNVSYLSSIYNIQILFALLTIQFLIKGVKRKNIVK